MYRKNVNVIYSEYKVKTVKINGAIQHNGYQVKTVKIVKYVRIIQSQILDYW